MIKNSFLLTFLGMILVINTACAESKESTEKAAPSSSSSTTKLVVIEDDFDSIKENVEMAITDRGLIVSGILHISDMLNRTGEDLGIDKPLYSKAEGIEFCSARISHKMAQVDPTNVAMCPFTVVVYQLTDSPKKIHLTYRYVTLKGDGAEVEKEITQLLQGIVNEATE